MSGDTTCALDLFHTMNADKERTYETNRALKCRLVEQGHAHAALVLHGQEVVAGCQFGSPEEVPNIYHRKQYEQELDVLSGYRITCVFVGKAHRRRGLSAVALQGALRLIADAGGGAVEGYPHDKRRCQELRPVRQDPGDVPVPCLPFTITSAWAVPGRPW